MVGPKTLAAINARDPKELFYRLWKRREQYINNICEKNPSQKKFRKGWMNRLEAIRYGSITCNTIPSKTIEF